jgi:hypothetical protein
MDGRPLASGTEPGLQAGSVSRLRADVRRKSRLVAQPGSHAVVAQQVERCVANAEVAGSNPVNRSIDQAPGGVDPPAGHRFRAGRGRVSPGETRLSSQETEQVSRASSGCLLCKAWSFMSE